MSAGPSRRSRGSHSPRHGQRERRKDDTADVLGDSIGVVQNGSVVWNRFVHVIATSREDLLRFARDSDVGVLRFDENRSSSFS